MSNNLPDDCQGYNSRYPWNQEDAPECPDCGSDEIDDNSDKTCVDLECCECGWTRFEEIGDWD